MIKAIINLLFLLTLNFTDSFPYSVICLRATSQTRDEVNKVNNGWEKKSSCNLYTPFPIWQWSLGSKAIPRDEKG